MSNEYKTPDLKSARMRKGEILHERFTLDEEFFNIGKNLKYRIQTYGCQGNEADSEMISGILRRWDLLDHLTKEMLILSYLIHVQ